MINTIELEKRWFRYKTKIFRSLFFILFFVLTIPYLSYYLFQQYTLLIDKDKNISKIVTQDEQLTVKNELATKVEKNVTKEISLEKESHDVILSPSIPIIDFNNQKQIDRETEEKKSERSREEKERAYRKKIAKRKALERKRALKKEASQKRELVKAKASSTISSTQLNVLSEDDIKKEHSREPKKINFQRSNSNYMAIMKRKFEQNKNPREAILIAKAYYKAGNYVESEKWALSANNLDKESAESWFLFAKSKAKLGKRREALKILLSYYKKTKLPETKELIEKIQSGSI